MAARATPKPRSLSKSRIQSGRQCHKRLWLEVHQPRLIQWDESAAVRLEEGTAFGELARDLLGGGTLIEADHLHVKEALADTAAALARPAPEAPRLFEAALEYDGVRVRVDALEREPRSDTLIEVKSSTQVKDEHLWDCAIQTWVARGAGRPVDRVQLAHADRDFVYRKVGDYTGLLHVEDITVQVQELLPQIPGIVAEMKRIVAGPKPNIGTGSHCSQPYGCPLLTHCQSEEPAPPEFPLDTLPRVGKLLASLQAAVYSDLREVPESLLSSPIHRRVAAATRSGEPFVSPQLESVLKSIGYPRYHLDFESISFVVPRWLGTRPFQQVPFQFSCHIEHRRGALRHDSFLDLSGDCPLDAFADRLLETLGAEGPILVWNKAFEATCVADLASRYPNRCRQFEGIIGRMVDLLPIYREHYYHPAMRGSWSIKSVLPTVAPELAYDDLEVGGGGAAQLAYSKAIHPDTSSARREELREHLLTYCRRDTEALVRLASWL